MPTRFTATGWGALLFCLMIGSAWAEVVVVVSVQNPVETLSRAELSDIYLGRLNRLPNGASVVPIDQREGTSTRGEFYKKYLGITPAQVKAHWSRLIFTGRGQPPRSVPGDDAVADVVAEAPNAIGYLDPGPGLVDDRLRVVTVE
ncbi:phosphate ABC transporter substrate-binding protein [Halomonas lysinitropha]|uniref:Phosphate ABC transporter substrate-binding protein n=1 Tax=Halomonas lysinitropha TaxID=2607506 RepID=A0A5K1I9Y5_9GAMM|nr:phosphate ABC transporter substrate-binding protein [Halomonas lysinitropha]VVZ95962.1 hypothetical protein HALO32_02045 [Halomonas lysinitropha]